MPQLSNVILAGIGLGLFITVSVGPTLFAVIKYSLNHSYRAGLAFVFGVSMSDIMYVTLANLAAPFLKELHKFENILIYGGGALLMAIGIAGVVKKYKPKRPGKELVKLSTSHYFRIWLNGFIINSINPGVIINWLTSATITAAYTVLYRFAFFGSCLFVALGIDTLKVFLADKIRRSLTLRKVMILQRFSSFVLLLIGISLIAFKLLNVQVSTKGIHKVKAETSIKIKAV